MFQSLSHRNISKISQLHPRRRLARPNHNRRLLSTHHPTSLLQPITSHNIQNYSLRLPLIPPLSSPSTPPISIHPTQLPPVRYSSRPPPRHRNRHLLLAIQVPLRQQVLPNRTLLRCNTRLPIHHSRPVIDLNPTINHIQKSGDRRWRRGNLRHATSPR